MVHKSGPLPHDTSSKAITYPKYEGHRPPTNKVVLLIAVGHQQRRNSLLVPLDLDSRLAGLYELASLRWLREAQRVQKPQLLAFIALRTPPSEGLPKKGVPAESRWHPPFRIKRRTLYKL